MKIWIFNNYNMLPEQGGLNRHYYFAKELKAKGHEPVVFVGSHPHNTNLQMIEGKEAYKVDDTHGFPWVYVKTYNYSGSKIKRVFSMFQYCKNVKKAAKNFQPPDVIIGSSAHPFAASLAIKLGKKYHCQSIVEIRDLWPESIVAYGIAGPHNPAVIAMRHLEKKIYTRANKLIFTMEGAYDYIIERGWNKKISREKVYYVNNGVDINLFDFNKDHFQIKDEDLNNSELFKVVYTGSIRKVNNLGLLLDVAKKIKNPKIKFLIWGDGDEKCSLEQRILIEGINNVVFKGRIEKKYIPYIVSRANLNFAHNDPSPLFRFGISFNKIFDYLAAGNPVFCDFPCKYNPVIQGNAGLCSSETNSVMIAGKLDEISYMDSEELVNIGRNARNTAEKFSYKTLSSRLIDIILEK